jgi:hypothetical protein
MDRTNRLADHSPANAPRLVAVSTEELTLVSGGGLWSAIKSAATWVKDHVYVSIANRVIGVKGTF